MATTWAGTATNQLITIAAWNDFQPTATISGTSTKAITVAQVAASGCASSYYLNGPIASMASNRCPTKQDILSTQ